MFPTFEVDNDDVNVAEKPDIGAKKSMIYWMLLRNLFGMAAQAVLNCQ